MPVCKLNVHFLDFQRFCLGGGLQTPRFFSHATDRTFQFSHDNFFHHLSVCVWVVVWDMKGGQWGIWLKKKEEHCEEVIEESRHVNEKHVKKKTGCKDQALQVRSREQQQKRLQVKIDDEMQASSGRFHCTDSVPPQDNDQLWQATSLEFRKPHLMLSAQDTNVP